MQFKSLIVTDTTIYSCYSGSIYETSSKSSTKPLLISYYRGYLQINYNV